MIARRDVLKIAAALGLSRALPADLDPLDAADRLAGSAADPLPAVGHSTLLDPARFADEANSDLFDTFSDLPGDCLYSFVAPEEYAAYKRERLAMAQALPLLAEVRFDHPWHEMDSAVVGLMTSAYHQGVRNGAAFEHLRRTMIGPVKTCQACEGAGAVEPDGSRWDAGAAVRCAACNGVGTVAA